MNWNDVKHFFKRFANGWKRVMIRIFGKDALKALGVAAKKLLKSELGKIVMAVVAELVQSNLSNSEKREEALRRIKDQAKESGLEYKTGIINLLIELAVNRLKGAVEE